MSEVRWVAIGAFLAALGVGLGAFGAHGLEGRISADSLNTFEVGVRYHLIHALGLILVGILADRSSSRATTLAGFLLLAGIVLFSGGIYVWCLSGVRAFVHIVPVGGVSFLAGWIALAIAASRR